MSTMAKNKNLQNDFFENLEIHRPVISMIMAMMKWTIQTMKIGLVDGYT